MSGFLSNINIRLILVHFIGFWFFFYSGETFGFLRDRSFFHPLYNAIAQAQFPERYAADVNFIKQAGNIAALIGYILAWSISSKRGWHWINDLLAFAICVVLGGLNWLAFDHLSYVFLAPGRIFPVNSLATFLVNGFFMLGLGLLILLSKRLMRFIAKGQHNYRESLVKEKLARRVR